MRGKTNLKFKERAILLRKEGKTYSEISKELGGISKSTLSEWCRKIQLSSLQKIRIQKMSDFHLKKIRLIAVESNHQKRLHYLNKIKQRVSHLGEQMKNDNVTKIALAMPYLGEGAKNRHGALLFGNSDPKIIALFLRGLRQSFPVDERKFRVTVQCRADQDIENLENFWFNVTKIPRSQFRKPQIDPRTKGKPKPSYKGFAV